MGGYLLLL